MKKMQININSYIFFTNESILWIYDCSSQSDIKLHVDPTNFKASKDFCHISFFNVHLNATEI